METGDQVSAERNCRMLLMMMMMRYQDAARHVVSVALTRLNTVRSRRHDAACTVPECFCLLLLTLALSPQAICLSQCLDSTLTQIS